MSPPSGGLGGLGCSAVSIPSNKAHTADAWDDRRASVPDTRPGRCLRSSRGSLHPGADSCRALPRGADNRAAVSRMNLAGRSFHGMADPAEVVGTNRSARAVRILAGSLARKAKRFTTCSSPQPQRRQNPRHFRMVGSSRSASAVLGLSMMNVATRVLAQVTCEGDSGTCRWAENG